MENLNVALLVRKSRTDIEQERKALERGEKYDTLKRHRTELLRVARSRNYNIMDIFEEVVSGDTIEARPEFQKLLKNVENRKYDAVLIIDVDRLSRGNKKEQGLIEDIFAKSDTLIITPSEIIDLNTEGGAFTADVKGFIARAEYRMIKKRLKEGKKRSVTEGKDLSRFQPYGYSKDIQTKKLIPNEYADNARMIFELYDKIGTINGLIKELHSLGINSPTGKPYWHKKSLQRVLTNKKYIGYMFHFKDSINYTEIPNAHTPLISEELFERVNGKLSKLKDTKENRKYDLANPFAGISKCGLCNKALKFARLKYNYMMCENKACNNKMIRFDDYEHVFIEKLEDILKSITVNISTLQDTTDNIRFLENALKDIEKEKAELAIRENNLYVYLENNTYTPDIFKIRLDQLNKERSELLERETNILQKIEYEKQLKTKIHDVAPTIRNALEIYHISSAKQKNRILKAFVREVRTIKEISNRYDKSFTMDIILHNIE